MTMSSKDALLEENKVIEKLYDSESMLAMAYWEAFQVTINYHYCRDTIKSVDANLSDVPTRVA